MSGPLSSHCSMLPSLTLKIFLLTNSTKSKSHYIIPIHDNRFIKNCLLNFSNALFHPLKEFVTTDLCQFRQCKKISFEIFASFDIYENSTSEKCSLYSYHRICLRVNLSHNTLNPFLHCLFLYPGTICLPWMCFAEQKCCLFTTILKFKSVKVSNSVLPRLS